MIGPEHHCECDAALQEARRRIAELEVLLDAREALVDGEVEHLRALAASVQRKNVKLHRGNANLQAQVVNLKKQLRRMAAERDEFKAGNFTAALVDQRRKYEGVIASLVDRINRLSGETAA